MQKRGKCLEEDKTQADEKHEIMWCFEEGNEGGGNIRYRWAGPLKSQAREVGWAK